MSYPGHVRHHHGGAHLGRGRRAHAVLRLRHLHLAVGGGRLFARSPTGSGAGGWLADMGALDFAGGTVVHVNAGVAALVGGDLRRQAARLSLVVAPPAQRAVHAARRRPALVRLVRLQRRQRAGGEPDRGPRVHHDDVRAGRRARRLDPARWHPPPTVDGGRCGNRDRRRPRRHHAGGGLRLPDERDCPRRDRRGAQLFRDWSGGRKPSSTTRSTSSPRTAWVEQWAPSSPGSSRRSP